MASEVAKRVVRVSSAPLWQDDLLDYGKAAAVVQDAADIDEATAWMQARNPEAAHRWYWGLLAAIEGLSEFPAP
jgi:hypothetical protein